MTSSICQSGTQPLYRFLAEPEDRKKGDDVLGSHYKGKVSLPVWPRVPEPGQLLMAAN